MFVRRIDVLGYARLKHWRIYGEEGHAHHEVAVWLGDGGLVDEYGGDAPSRYDVSFSPGETRLRNVTNPRLFATKHRPQQLKLFTPGGALDDSGRLEALALRGYAARSRGRPEALQQVLFPYHVAWG